MGGLPRLLRLIVPFLRENYTLYQSLRRRSSQVRSLSTTTTLQLCLVLETEIWIEFGTLKIPHTRRHIHKRIDREPGSAVRCRNLRIPLIGVAEPITGRHLLA
jgi:hypothetical protein